MVCGMPKVRAMAVNASPASRRAIASRCRSLLRVGGLVYTYIDTMSVAAITDIRGPRLSAAHTRFGRNISIVRAASLLGGCAVVADCSMIVAWLQTVSGTGAANSGSSP